MIVLYVIGILVGVLFVAGLVGPAAFPVVWYVWAGKIFVVILFGFAAGLGGSWLIESVREIYTLEKNARRR